MAYRNRPDPRRFQGGVPFQNAAYLRPTISLSGPDIIMDFPVTMSLNDPDQLAATEGCFDAITGDVFPMADWIQSTPTRVRCTAPFDIESNGGMFWIRYDQTALLASDGRIIDPTPFPVVP